MSARIKRLRDAVQAEHGCMAAHVESVPVLEKSGGQTLWQGVVEVFKLLNHPRAKRCFAWFTSDQDDGPCTTVLEIPPVDSARAAVKVVFEGGRPLSPPPAPPPPEQAS